MQRLHLTAFILAALAAGSIQPGQAQTPVAPAPATPAPASTPTSDQGVAHVADYIEVQPGAAARAGAALARYRDAARKEEGMISVIAVREEGRPNRLALIETWKNRAALDAHAKAAAATALAADLKPVLLAPEDRRVNFDFLNGPEMNGSSGRRAVYVLTHVDVHPNDRVKAEAMLKELADAADKEAGVKRFDAQWQDANPNHFTVVEVWSDQKTYNAHDGAAPALKFRASLGPILGALYDQRTYRELP